MLKATHISILCFSLLALTGCYYDIEEELYPGNFCDTGNITFSGTIKPLIQTRCALPGCHVTGAQSPDLTNDATIKSAADQGLIRQRVIDRQPTVMPPTGALPPCELQQVQAWLDAGAPITN